MIEIERKFLVKTDEYKNGVPHRICQGYICSEKDRVVRIRIYDNNAVITIKNATIGFARNEYEYQIPIKDAEEMLENTCMQPIIEKTRYVYEYNGHTWEIDEFKRENEGLVVAEIELENKEECFDIPDWIGEEVTNNAKYYNACLIKHPFNKWQQVAND